jgi:formylglycine-generating enzyme required for sulfatase activity
MRDLVRDGYRPVGIDAVLIGNTGLVTASVWHRPVISEQTRDQLAERQARAAVTLVRMGKAEEVFPLLRYSSDPRLRSFIINWLNPLGADPKVIATALDRIDPSVKPTHAEPPKTMNAILFHPNTSMRRALILALGTYGTKDLSPTEREPLSVKLLDLYRNDPDSGIHGAAAWTLRQWKQQAKLQAADDLMKMKDRGDRRWFVNSQGQTFAVIEGPVEFDMGSPSGEPLRFDNEILHRVQIPRLFAIAATEVTVEQYQEFVKENPGVDHANSDWDSPDPKGPMNNMSWYDAAAYCNWLSRKENLPVCYEPNERGKYAASMCIKADALKLSGYRLPTEAEWEYACRSGAVTSRYYGLSIELLGRYAQYVLTSQGRAWPCGSLLPNDLGLSDMLGNMWEWCQDRSLPYRTVGKTYIDAHSTILEIISEELPRVLRGGAFHLRPELVRSALRNGNGPAVRHYLGGFRPSRTCH